MVFSWRVFSWRVFSWRGFSWSVFSKMVHHPFWPVFFTREWVLTIAPAPADRSEGGKTENPNFAELSKELGPRTITIGTVLFWSWGFWD